MFQAPVGSAGSPHVIVVGNEKGGSGKTTIAMHIAVALMRAGRQVATIDIDSRQKSLTHYIENRRAWARRTGANLELPDHFSVARAEGVRVDENEAAEFAAFETAVEAVQHGHDFVIIDTPSYDSFLMRLAHSMTDTLVTPLNDSFLDLDVLATVDPVTFTVAEVSHYAEMVREARRQRRLVDGLSSDWVVVRNRLSVLGSRNKSLISDGLTWLSGRLGFSFVDGFSERLTYREMFPRGLTALDAPNETAHGVAAGRFCLTAGREVETLVAALNLPSDDRAQRRAAARAQWFASHDAPLDTHEILVS